MEEDPKVQKSNKWLESLSKGLCNQLEALSMEGLQVVEAHKGFVLCKFVVSDRITDSSGNWHVGAMATLIDDVGAAAVYSAAGEIRASFDFSISFYSTAKTQEEVEIQAKVAGDKERITSVVIEVRRKDNGELIALAGGCRSMSACCVLGLPKIPEMQSVPSLPDEEAKRKCIEKLKQVLSLEELSR